MLSNSSTNQGVMQRVGLLTVSIAMITVTLHSSGVLGWMVILPLAAIYPGISAITGWDPLNALYSSVTRHFGGGSNTLAHQS